MNQNPISGILAFFPKEYAAMPTAVTATRAPKYMLLSAASDNPYPRIGRTDIAA